MDSRADSLGCVATKQDVKICNQVKSYLSEYPCSGYKVLYVIAVFILVKHIL